MLLARARRAARSWRTRRCSVLRAAARVRRADAHRRKPGSGTGAAPAGAVATGDCSGWAAAGPAGTGPFSVLWMKSAKAGVQVYTAGVATAHGAWPLPAVGR
jgi:hypothetical protein